jgi:hypothetical protein
MATVGISTAIFFSIWRLCIDAHQYLTGVPMSELGAWAFVMVMVMVGLPIMLAVLGLCLDRCVVWWQGVLTFFASIAATFYFIASTKLRFLLPVGLLGEGTNSSPRWYWGCILQLVVAFFLLRYFNRFNRPTVER